MNQIAALTAAMLVGNRQNRGGTSERRPSALLPWNSTINFVQCKRIFIALHQFKDYVAFITVAARVLSPAAGR